MSGKIIKAAIFSLVAVMLLSMIFPGGVSSGLNHEVDAKNIYGSDNVDEFLYPDLRIEEPKVSYIVRGENGEKTIIEIPEDTKEEEIEVFIFEILQGAIIDYEVPEVQEVPELLCGNDIQIYPKIEREKNRVYLVKYNYANSLDGYLFCDINEPLKFDASSLITSYVDLKLEWDIDGDGVYDYTSTSTKFSYNFTEMGLYNLNVRVTYSYQYSYYPTYGIDEITLYEPSVSDSQNKRGIDIPGDVEYYIQPITQTSMTKSEEYEIKVSVGSKDTGYPPLLDFELSSKAEEEVISGGDGLHYILDISTTQVKLPDTGWWIQPEPIIFPPVIINPPLFSTSPDNVVVLVRTVYNQDGYTQNLDDCIVKFDASKTKDKNVISNYNWDFGDGESASGMIVNHTYTQRGTYTATLSIEGWDLTLNKTFYVKRGSHDPKQVMITSYYGYSLEDYLLCAIDDPMIFDIHVIVGYLNYEWIEWDFDGDGNYEVNRTEPWIKKSFSESGYYLVGFRYTFLQESYDNILFDVDDSTTNSDSSNMVYKTNTYWIKVIVQDENKNFPLVPDFTTIAPNGFSWWNQNNNHYDFENSEEQKNVTHLKYYNKWTNRLNSWNNPVSFAANISILPEGEDYDDYYYLWDFGDGSSGSGLYVEHEFENVNEDYLVTLTLKRDGYTKSVTKMVAPRRSSPNIYLYRETPGYDTIKVVVDGRVTKAVPKVDLGPEIVWEDVWIEDGKVFYKDKSHDFLYYEELLDHPKTSEFGWVLERDNLGKLFLNENPITLEELKEFFRDELAKTGLFENEITDFVDEWLGKGARLFPSQTSFRYAIMYIPEDQIEDIIQIETEKTYEEIIRVHFLIQPVEKGFKLLQPEYPEHNTGANILHEWGVYPGDPLLKNTKSLKADSNHLFNGITEYQTNWVSSNLKNEDQGTHLRSTVSSLPGPSETISAGTPKLFSK
jgi:hypothetical protein